MPVDSEIVQKNQFGKKFINSIGGQNNKGKKHTKQQKKAKSKVMMRNTKRKIAPEQLEFAMKYGVLYAEFEVEAGGGRKIYCSVVLTSGNS